MSRDKLPHEPFFPEFFTPPIIIIVYTLFFSDTRWTTRQTISYGENIVSSITFLHKFNICRISKKTEYIGCKLDNLIDRKSFWTLDFNWETFMQPSWAKYLGQRRKELFPVTLNNSCPLDWNWLILVSEIQNTNMSSCEMISSQQFSQCLIFIWRPCWSWTMNSITWCRKEILKEILQIKWI